MLYNAKFNPLLPLLAVGLSLGAVFGLASLRLWLNPQSKLVNLYYYINILTLYHMNEFYCTFNYQRLKVTLHSFLIWGNKGNTASWFMHFLLLLEFYLHKCGFFQMTILHYPLTHCLSKIGFLLAFFGVLIRHISMRHCGDSFNHYIQTTPLSQKLITTGIYKYFRHPSYFGFYCLAIGMQLILENRVNLLFSIVILARFFSVRIKFEEYYLIHTLFGQDYIDYKKRAGIYIPFVRVD